MSAIDGIVPPLMSRDEQIGSADFETLFPKIMNEADAIVRAEGLYVVDFVEYPTREEATMARMELARRRVLAREKTR